MPPWAAPVWLRVGYSLVRTAVRTRGPASTAARMPAPPAPTITTSYRCSLITVAAADDAVGAPPAAQRRGDEAMRWGYLPLAGEGGFDHFSLRYSGRTSAAHTCRAPT